VFDIRRAPVPHRLDEMHELALDGGERAHMVLSFVDLFCEVVSHLRIDLSCNKRRLKEREKEEKKRSDASATVLTSMLP
jgi:hypothetical protein